MAAEFYLEIASELLAFAESETRSEKRALLEALANHYKLIAAQSAASTAMSDEMLPAAAAKELGEPIIEDSSALAV